MTSEHKKYQNAWVTVANYAHEHSKCIHKCIPGCYPEYPQRSEDEGYCFYYGKGVFCHCFNDLGGGDNWPHDVPELSRVIVPIVEHVNCIDSTPSIYRSMYKEQIDKDEEWGAELTPKDIMGIEQMEKKYSEHKNFKWLWARLADYALHHIKCKHKCLEGIKPPSLRKNRYDVDCYFEGKGVYCDYDIGHDWQDLRKVIVPIFEHRHCNCGGDSPTYHAEHKYCHCNVNGGPHTYCPVDEEDHYEEEEAQVWGGEITCEDLMSIELMEKKHC